MSIGPMCTRRWCNTRKVEARDSNGRIIWVCPPCEINRQGLCREKGCTAPSAGPKSMRCAPHQKKRLAKQVLDAQLRRYRNNPEWREKQKRKAKERWHDPARHEANLRALRARRKPRGQRDGLDRAKARAWYATRPKPDRTRENQKRRDRYQNDAAHRERINAQNRAKWHRRQEAKRAAALAAQQPRIVAVPVQSTIVEQGETITRITYRRETVMGVAS